MPFPSTSDDVISLMPAIFANCRSSGVATADAIVSGSAPGSPAPTEITGYSTSGRLATGSSLYATAPARIIAIDSRNVATGRLINGAEKCTVPAVGIRSKSRSAFVLSAGSKSLCLRSSLIGFSPRSPHAHARASPRRPRRCGDTCARCGRRTGKPPAS